MSDIIVRGMEMPKSCEECRFHVDGWCYGCEPESDEERKRTTTKYCPLVELSPHGRLIDQDAILREVIRGDYPNQWIDKNELLRLFRNAPTVIPASEEVDNG